MDKLKSFAMPRKGSMVVLGALWGGLACALLAACAHKADQPIYVLDVLIKGGRVIDGSGKPAFAADVGIAGGKIVAVGPLAGARAARTVDATGKIVVPGFIDMHSHADTGLASSDAGRRAAPNLVTQGITTVLVNPDGGGPWPLEAQRASMEKVGVGPNVALMAGHGTIRQHVMGNDHRRPATADEIQRMRALLRQAMEAGAFGLSAGLEYVPGIWSTTDELVALVREIVPFGGVYSVHQRSESTDPRWYRPSVDKPEQPTMLDATTETIQIGERTGARVVWSHCKVMGSQYWGHSTAAIALVNQARGRGVDVWADQYPYRTTGGDGSMILIPGWAVGVDQTIAGRKREGHSPSDYGAALTETLADPAVAARVRQDISYEMARRGSAENILVMDYPQRSLVGKSLAEVAKSRGVPPVEMAIHLQLEGYRDRHGGARLRGFSAAESDVEALMAQPWTATSTDAGIALPEDGPNTHVRSYGTYPRKLRHYALDRGVLSLENAVRSSTSLPAQILRLADRGLIRPGFLADLAVIDVARLRERSTIQEPHQYSEGIDYVLVGGRFVVEAGKPNGALPGKVLSLPR